MMNRSKMRNNVSGKIKSTTTSSSTSETLSELLRQHTMPLDKKIMYLTMHDDESSDDEQQLPSINDGPQNKRRPSYESKMKLINGHQKSCLGNHQAVSSASSSSNGMRKTVDTSLLVCHSVSGTTHL